MSSQDKPNSQPNKDQTLYNMGAINVDPSKKFYTYDDMIQAQKNPQQQDNNEGGWTKVLKSMGNSMGSSLQNKPSPVQLQEPQYNDVSMTSYQQPQFVPLPEQYQLPMPFEQMYQHKPWFGMGR